MPRRSILVFEMGYAHGSGFALKLWAKGRTMGPAQNLRGALRRGRASPHARLKARTFREVKVLFRQTLSGL
jgi:hypothetical protein